MAEDTKIVKKKLKDRWTTFDYINAIGMILFSITIIYPFVNTFAKSISTEHFITSGQIYWLPMGVTFDSYAHVMLSSAFLSAFQNTVFITIVGTALSLSVVFLAGYAYSRTFRGHRFFFFIMLVTMFINGGMIPTYLIVDGLELTNTLWAMIIPNAFGMYNMILARNFFYTLPGEVFESGILDGCSEMQLFLKIAVPMAKPIIATLALFLLVNQWNTFMSAIIYIRDARFNPLQVYVRTVVFAAQLSLDADALSQANDAYQTSAQGIEGVKATVLIVTILPIICTYPFLQRYFVKGINMGAVKG